MRGGKRPGAGRKKGAKTKRKSAIAKEAVNRGISPIEVMLETMRELWAEGKKTEACVIAHDAAPYCHSRMPIALVPAAPPGQQPDAAPDDKQILDLYLSGVHEEADGD